MPPRRLSLKELPEDERPREKLQRDGEASLTDAELLAVILGSGTTTETAIQLAQRMLKEVGDLHALSLLSMTELKRFHGIGIARAAQVKAALEMAHRCKELVAKPSSRFNNSKLVYQHFASHFHGKRQEEFWVAVLDTKNKLIHQAQITRGTLAGSLIHPREIFHLAIRNLGAGIIVLHNHPSGDPEPSQEDLKATRQISEASKIVGIQLLDHIIIGNGTYFSFKDSGLL